VLVQNTGLLESGDAIRGTVVRMKVPLVCLVTYRGYAGLAAAGSGTGPAAQERNDLVRSDIDSAAILTEPTLQAWRIPYRLLHDDADRTLVREAFALADRRQQPVAVLLAGPTTP